MPVNRNALIRYRTIDSCLRNRYRKWTLDDLVGACSDALYEYEGIDKGVSRRSVQLDIQTMRSDKLGYNAPIIVKEKKYYTYEDPGYSITSIPLTQQDLLKLTEVVEILKQFKGFSHFAELGGMVQRLENKIHSAATNTEPVIDFEKNENLKGLEHIDTIYQAILNKCAVTLCYQSFKARTSETFNFHPYYLKEYRNRWFVLGSRKKKSPVITLALDRIAAITPCDVQYIDKEKSFNINEYLRDVIGVSVNTGDQKETVRFFADRETAPYIRTKPLHHSQQEVETYSEGAVFVIEVKLNFELERELLGFGDRIRVLGPPTLRRRIRETLTNAVDQYEYELHESALNSIGPKLTHKGFLILNNVFTKKEVNQLKAYIERYLASKGASGTHAVRDILGEIPELSTLLFTDRLKQILKKLGQNLFLTKALYFNKTQESNWYVTWHQDVTISVREKIQTPGYSGWTRKEGYFSVCPPEEILRNTVTIRIHLDETNQGNGVLQVVPGSHKKKMTSDEIAMVSQNSIPFDCCVPAGGIHIMRPLLLHASAKASNQKQRRVLHLEFSSGRLAPPLEWAEEYHL